MRQALDMASAAFHFIRAELRQADHRRAVFADRRPGPLSRRER